ncbi:MAG: EVE domain-containing protein [Bryobacter sp.]|nr:EVE domain-containing protein [Bryobacter sp.]
MAKTSYFLLKSDPDEYGLAHLEQDGSTTWDGVTNPQALMALRKIKAQDVLLIYHSGGESALCGWAYASEDALADAVNPKLATVIIRFGGRLTTPVTLKEVKETQQFNNFALVRQGRLSTMEVPLEFIQWLKAKKCGFRP